MVASFTASNQVGESMKRHQKKKDSGQEVRRSMTDFNQSEESKARDKENPEDTDLV